MGRRKLELGVLVVLLAAPAVAQADPTITITPVTGPHFVVRTNGTDIDARTDQRTASFVVTSDTAGSLTCSLNTIAPGACGAPPPGCPAAACATFTPSAPGAGQGDSETVFVSLLDPGGSTLASTNYTYVFDITPPNTLNGTDPDPSSQVNPLRPAFNASIEDDDFNFNVVPGADVMQCSFVREGSRPRWASCPVDNRGTANFTAGRLPDRHIDYTFSARSVDDLGRVDPTPVSTLFDPVPCAVSVGRVSGHSLSRSPFLSVTLQCTAVTETDVAAFVLQGYGSRTISAKAALTNGSSISDKRLRLHLRSGHATGHLKLNVGSHYATYFRHYRTVTLLVVAGDPSGPSPTNSLATVTARR